MTGDIGSLRTYMLCNITDTLLTIFQEIDYGDSQPYVEVTCYLPATFGVWKFAVEAIDAEGNVQAGGLEEIERVVSGTEPSPMTDFSLSSYDSETDTFTFAIG